MNRKLRQSHSLAWRGIRNAVIVAVAAVTISCAVLAFLAVWDYREARDRSMEARLALIERQMARKSRPIIQVQRASIYSMEGELVLETYPPKGNQGAENGK
ncbi:MAG: hypothetical protein PVG49_21085 [Desulfobacteraceae bacterium]|jgi:hypothetical protein